MTNINVTHILNVFFDEISDRSGKMLENFRHNERAFARALLPNQTEVKAKDVLQAGVALKATPSSLELHPFVYRQVCRNGTILGKSTQSHKLGQAGDSCRVEVDGKAGEVIAAAEVEGWFRDAVGVCCQPEAFYDGAQKFLTSLHWHFHDKVVVEKALAASLTSENFPAHKRHFEEIMREYLNHDEPTLFRLVNAVTAVARDLHDPDQKWKLECFGGELALNPPSLPVLEGGSEKALPTEKSLVRI